MSKEEYIDAVEDELLIEEGMEETASYERDMVINESGLCQSESCPPFWWFDDNIPS